MEFSKLLIQWYLQNKRDLPWRKTSDPYPIWLSEIMLQQTRVAQGLPYFLRFIEAFPTIFDLADANEEQVLKLWQGLGYYSRARNLHATAKYVANNLEGKFPAAYKDLLKLKGVGDYTAAAIASIAYGEPVPVVDGNVYRVLSRYFGVNSDISSPAAKKEFTLIASGLLPGDNASHFNQAMMEFGALQCVPKNPNCSICVFNNKCVAYQTGKVNELPVKLKKTKVTSRYFNYLIINDGLGNTLINKRTQKGIWHNLYEFPLLETNSVVKEEDIVLLTKSLGLGFVPGTINLLNRDVIVHKLSHQHLYINFWEIKTSSIVKGGITTKEAMALPFPIVIYKFIEEHWV